MSIVDDVAGGAEKTLSETHAGMGSPWTAYAQGQALGQKHQELQIQHDQMQAHLAQVDQQYGTLEEGAWKNLLGQASNGASSSQLEPVINSLNDIRVKRGMKPYDAKDTAKIFAATPEQSASAAKLQAYATNLQTFLDPKQAKQFQDMYEKFKQEPGIFMHARGDELDQMVKSGQAAVGRGMQGGLRVQGQESIVGIKDVLSNRDKYNSMPGSNEEKLLPKTLQDKVNNFIQLQANGGQPSPEDQTTMNSLNTFYLRGQSKLENYKNDLEQYQKDLSSLKERKTGVPKSILSLPNRPDPDEIGSLQSKIAPFVRSIGEANQSLDIQKEFREKQSPAIADISDSVLKINKEKAKNDAKLSLMDKAIESRSIKRIQQVAGDFSQQFEQSNGQLSPYKMDAAAMLSSLSKFNASAHGVVGDTSGKITNNEYGNLKAAFGDLRSAQNSYFQSGLQDIHRSALSRSQMDPYLKNTYKPGSPIRSFVEGNIKRAGGKPVNEKNLNAPGVGGLKQPNPQDIQTMKSKGYSIDQIKNALQQHGYDTSGVK